MARVLPELQHLHYGLTSSPQGSLCGITDRLERGNIAMLDRILSVAEMASWPAGSRGLDVGCGLGGTSLLLAERLGFTMTGCNINAAQVERARKTAADRGLTSRARFDVADALDLPYPADAFDFAVLIEVAFHIDDKAALFAELARVVRPGGTVVLVDQERLEAREVMGLFYFPARGDYAWLAKAAGFAVTRERDCSTEVAHWMADYASVGGGLGAVGVMLLALARGGPRLALDYLRALTWFQRRIRDDTSLRAFPQGHLPGHGSVAKLRWQTRAELLDGRSRYAIQVFQRRGP